MELVTDSQAAPKRPHRIVIMVGGSILIAFALVSLAMVLYTTSGTAELDLSRPAYKDVRSKVIEDDIKDFPSSGEITQDTIKEFKKTYAEQAQQATSTDGFGSNALDDASLGFEHIHRENP